MVLAWLITLLALGAIAWPFLTYWREVRKRRETLAQPFPEAWREMLQRRIPLYSQLPPDRRANYEDRVRRFVADKRFYGCNGLAVTEEMRLLVAGLACLLILRPAAAVFPRLRSVLLYPTAFWVRHEEPDELGLVPDGPVEQVGESWEGDRVVLSWEDVEAALDGDEVNVVAHEFAHQLDSEGPDTEGTPQLPDYTRWAEVMARAYEELCESGSPVIDDYGTENPAEFFAVATEAFFQSGAELKAHHADLYALLRDYYLVETASPAK